MRKQARYLFVCLFACLFLSFFLCFFVSEEYVFLFARDVVITLTVGVTIVP